MSAGTRGFGQEPLMGRPDELRIIARAKRGDADAFRQLVEAYKDRLFAYVYRMLRNHHEAEDVCQTAFVRAYQSLSSYCKNYAFSTWLFTIAYRLCLNELRKRKPYSGETEFGHIASTDDESPDRLAHSEQADRLQNAIWDAVGELSPAQRSAVLLFYREGLSCHEIGRVLGMPGVTVKSHLHRAREKLRQTLSGTAADPRLEFWDAADATAEPRIA